MAHSTDAPATDYELEDCIVRFKDLPQRQSTFQPLDTKVPKYARERYAVVGRGAEGSTKGKKTAEVRTSRSSTSSSIRVRRSAPTPMRHRRFFCR